MDPVIGSFPVDPSFLPLRMRRWAGSSHRANHGTQTILCKSLTSTLLFLVLLSVPVLSGSYGKSPRCHTPPTLR